MNDIDNRSVSNLFSLKGKVAAVLGAGGLLGYYHVEALVEAGACVVAVDLKIDELVEKYRSLGEVYLLEIDITKPTSLEHLRDYILTNFHKLDVLVNNAAINDKFEDPTLTLEYSKFENYPLDLWQKSLEVNLTGTFLSCQMLGQLMLLRHSGSIINVASTYAVVAPNQQLYQDEEGKQLFYKSPSYPSTKAAVLHFTRFLAAHWGSQGIRVNCLTPGGVENGQSDIFIRRYNKQTPLQRMAQPWDYKGAIVFLASDASAYMTGANLIVDGGYTIW